jgi:hypothetical protein
VNIPVSARLLKKFVSRFGDTPIPTGSAPSPTSAITTPIPRVQLLKVRISNSVECVILPKSHLTIEYTDQYITVPKSELRNLPFRPTTCQFSSIRGLSIYLITIVPIYLHRPGSLTIHTPQPNPFATSIEDEYKSSAHIMPNAPWTAPPEVG